MIAARAPHLLLALPAAGLAFLGACAPAPAPQTVSVIVPPPPAITAVPATAAPAPKPPAPAPLHVERTTLAASLDELAVSAPCDFARAYRGHIGPTKVSVVLRGDGDTLAGESHYDREGDGLAITGRRAGPTAFRADERRGGTFDGACDPSNGTLRGRYTLGGKTQGFELAPLPAGYPGLVWVQRRTVVEANDEDPACRAQGSVDVVREIETPEGATVLCLPHDPKKRKAALEGTELGHCWATDQGFRVFGGPSPDLDRKVNRVLRDAAGFDGSVKEIASCRPPRSIWATQRLVEIGDGILVVQVETSNDYGGGHPMNGVRSGTEIDLLTGEEVGLDEVVSNVDKLRELAAACVPIYTAALNRAPAAPPRGTIARCGDEQSDAGYLWGCKDALDAPMWTLTTQGIVIGGIGHSHAESVLDGTGPIIPWAVLAREGLLPAKSRVARLFRSTPPASPSDPPCWSGYRGDEWLSFH
ncbi:MAG: hypothetical protein U0359_24905 [Byssovorax sp.]